VEQAALGAHRAVAHLPGSHGGHSAARRAQQGMTWGCRCCSSAHRVWADWVGGVSDAGSWCSLQQHLIMLLRPVCGRWDFTLVLLWGYVHVQVVVTAGSRLAELQRKQDSQVTGT
jgi:hypothetical protein